MFSSHSLEFSQVSPYVRKIMIFYVSNFQEFLESFYRAVLWHVTLAIGYNSKRIAKNIAVNETGFKSDTVDCSNFKSLYSTEFSKDLIKID